MAVDPVAQTTCPWPLALTATRGDSIEVRIRFIDASTGRPIELTGYSSEANIYESANGTVPKHTIPVTVDQSGAGGATTGIVTIELAGSVSTTWIPTGFWALVLDNGTVRKTVVAGPWTLNPVSLAMPEFVCGLGDFAGACAAAGADIVGADCGTVRDGYTSLTLPYPSANCGC